MDWSKTKTIFIVVFLILDLFLLFQFVEKRNSNQLGLLAQATLEEQLRENEISYVPLPEDPIKETYISGSSRVFVSEDLQKLKNQMPLIINETQIYSKFEEPIPIADFSNEWLNSFIKANILEGTQYIFWDLDEEANTLIFFQTYEGKTIYYNKNGFLVIQLNDKNEMVEYKQTLLEEIDEMRVSEDKENSFTALKAIENMYERNELKQGSKVTKVELGYYTLIEDSQVFVPTWHFVIDDKENYFVNAFEGHIIRDSAKWSEE